MFFPRASASAAPASYRRETRPPRHLLGHGNQRHHPGHEETTAGKLGSRLAKVTKSIPRPGSRMGSRTLPLAPRSLARLPRAAGLPKFPNASLGKRTTASASLMQVGVPCLLFLRPPKIHLHRRLLHQLPLPPSQTSSLCNLCLSIPDTSARGFRKARARASQRPACCRHRTSTTEPSPPPRLHRLHWACWWFALTQTLVALALLQTSVAL